MLAECEDMLRVAEKEGETFGLVIIDTLQAYFTGDDSNRNSQVVKFLRSLRPITELAHKPTVLVPAHPTKRRG
jgi:RecA-family ATPase